MFHEKSANLIGAQYRMVEFRKAGNRDAALWYMRVAKSARQRDAADAQRFYDDIPGVWWAPRPTAYVNG